MAKKPSTRKPLPPKRPKLALSKINSQLELTASDLDITQLVLRKKGYPPLNIADAVIGGDIERTIEGASTVRIVVFDGERRIRTSKLLSEGAEINLDGLWFRLVDVDKSGDEFTLVFEDREVAILRTYNSVKTVAWDKTTRQWFVWNLIREVKEFKIPYFIEGLKQQAAKTREEKSAQQKADDRDFGLKQVWDPGGGTVTARLKVKGVPATAEQLKNAEIILDVGASMLLRRKLLVCAIMTAIVESTIHNLGPNPDGSWSVGVFQQRRYIDGKRTGWPASQNVAEDARGFYKEAQKANTPAISYGDLCQAVQRSAYPDAYAKYRYEAERFVTEYGILGYDYASDEVGSDLNRMDWAIPGAASATKYQFSRGSPGDKTQHQKEKREDSWECLGRLAEEINWRRFFVSGRLYFVSEPYLFKSASRATITEQTDGVNWINYKYEVGKNTSKNSNVASVTLDVFMDRWVVPPGAILTIAQEGPVNGRWLVTSIKRDLFSKQGEITCKKPRARLPEPTREELASAWGNIITGEDNKQQYYPGGPPADAPGAGERRFCFTVKTQYKRGGGASSHGSRAIGNWYSDNAVDIMYSSGSRKVLAIESGKIGPVTPRANNGRGFEDGSTVFLEGDSGEWWCYMHLQGPGQPEPLPGWIRQGRRVAGGELIGYIGRGVGGGDHLHLGRKRGNPEDVYNYQVMKDDQGNPSAPKPPPHYPEGTTR